LNILIYIVCFVNQIAFAIYAPVTSSGAAPGISGTDIRL
jgi:hypothetical protein